MNEKNLIHDFLENPSFRRLVLSNDKKDLPFWQEYLKKNPAEKEEFELAVVMLRFLATEETSISPKEIQKQWKLFENEVKADRNKPLFFIINTKIWAQAASIVFIVSSLVYYLYLQNISVSINNGKTKVVYLSDGSSVTLNANSTITYPKYEILHLKRKVELEGNAFFDIKKNIKPFIVESKLMKIEVLGTKFEVNTLLKDQTVFLQEGSISFQNKSDNTSFKLKPSEKLTYTNAGKITISKLDKNYRIDWLYNKLIFEETPLLLAAERIKQVYGITLVLDDKIKNEKFTGTFPYDSSPNPILIAIIKSYQVKWKKINATTLELYR